MEEEEQRAETPEISVEETRRILRDLERQDRAMNLGGGPISARANRSGRGGPTLRPFARSDYKSRSPQFSGDLRAVSKVFRSTNRCAGTWSGGPRVEYIRRRVVTDEETGNMLLEETFLQPDPNKNWTMPILGEGQKRRLRDIKVTLW